MAMTMPIGMWTRVLPRGSSVNGQVSFYAVFLEIRGSADIVKTVAVRTCAQFTWYDLRYVAVRASVRPRGMS